MMGAIIIENGFLPVTPAPLSAAAHVASRRRAAAIPSSEPRS